MSDELEQKAREFANKFYETNRSLAFETELQLMADFARSVLAQHHAAFEEWRGKSMSELKRTLAAAETERDKLREAVENLVFALDDNMKDELSVYQFASIHGYTFAGKGYAVELNAAKELIAQAALDHGDKK